MFFGSLCGHLADPFMIIQSFKLYVEGSQSSLASLVLWSTTEATMLDGLVECPLTMIAGKLYTRRKRISNRGVRSSNKRGVMMRSRSNNSSKRGACKGGVDEGRSRSSCSGKSRKRDA